MPWYYAGPEAKPVGPISAEQLHALRAAGTITPETFVIEHTGAGTANLAWKHYGELFPALPPAPPVPLVPLVPPVLPPAPAPQPAVIQPTAPAAPHPLFPSAAPVTASHPPYPAAALHHVDYPPIKPTNGWCAWGFGLSLIGFFFAFVCGIGLIPALVSVVLCTIGLVQVSKNREQSGQGLAIGGLVFSFIGLVVAVIFIACLGGPILKAHGLTVTEQTSNDSE